MRYVKRIPEKSGQTEQRIRMPVGTLTHFALIRRWRATFPTQGEGFFRLCKFFLFYFLILPVNRRCI